MTVTTAERRAIVLALLTEFGEDTGTIARFIRALRTVAPAINWKAELDAQAATFGPFTESRLSVQWWLGEVVRLAV